jgi:replicative DNA helicase
MTDGYAQWAQEYRNRLWMGVLPLPSNAKKPVPEGFTGRDGKYPDDEQIATWVRTRRLGNIALRMPGDVLGIDVDDYEYEFQAKDPATGALTFDSDSDSEPVMVTGRKNGGAVLAALEAELGPLPATWRSSSRGDGPSGIRFFRVPSGLLWGDFGLHLEGIWWKHRYAVVYPSMNPDSGRRYEWIDDTAHEPRWGVLPPKVTDIADLPEPWVARFGRTADQVKAPRTVPNAPRRSPVADYNGSRRFTRAQAEKFVEEHGLSVVRGAVDGEINNRLNDGAKVVSHFVPAFWSPLQAQVMLMGALSSTTYDNPRMALGTIDSALGSAAGDWVAELAPDPPPRKPRPTPPMEEPPSVSDQEDHGGQEEAWQLPQRPGQDLARQIEPYSPEFPVHHLPHRLRRFVEEVSASLQVPVTLTAMACLSAVAIIAGPRARIRQRPDFVENLNLATLVALPPGSLKSPTYRVVREPLKRIEREAQSRFDEQRDQIMERLQERIDDDDVSELVKDKIKRDMKGLEKLACRMFVQNATPEAMEQLAARNGGIVNMLDSEGSALGNIAGRYNKGVANLEFVLAAYDCDEYTIDRVSSGARWIERTCMTAGLTTQPDVLYELHDPKTKMHERGLLGRFVCALPQPIDDRTTDPPEISSVAVAGWDELLRDVGRLPVAPIHDPLYRYGPEADVIGIDKLPPVMGLSPEAMELHLAFEQRINELKHSQTGALAYMADWVAKHYGRCLRIAGLLHLAEGNEIAHPVSRATMQDAIGISWWMVSCARVVYGRWIDPGAAVEVDQIRAVTDWWTRAGKPDRFTLREVLRGLRGRKWAKKVDSLRPVMQALTDLSWWRPVEGLRGQVVYLVNPMLAEALGSSEAPDPPRVTNALD